MTIDDYILYRMKEERIITLAKKIKYTPPILEPLYNIDMMDKE